MPSVRLLIAHRNHGRDGSTRDTRRRLSATHGEFVQLATAAIDFTTVNEYEFHICFAEGGWNGTTQCIVVEMQLRQPREI